jgi:hypothetical protein
MPVFLRDCRPGRTVLLPRGEGMPQIKVCDRKVNALMRAALGAGLAAAVLCANTAARAGDDDDGPTMLGTILQGFGLKDPHATYAGID